jgi:hypothetical protein
VVGFCERGTESLGFIKCGEFHDQFSLSAAKKDSPRGSQYVI